ncbi:MAG: hypothetical protein KJO35_03275 [Gammaproteobacteria bacterium]|nr:hypothetical protein [Gammaproteobacteria bacterium]
MFVTQIGIRQWLARWFGTSSDSDNGELRREPGQLGLPAHTDEPLFSLGDTKQDVVVSYRPAQSEET